MIYTLVLIACMSSAPDAECVRYEKQFIASEIPYASYKNAQEEAAKYLEKHPELKHVKSLTYSPGRTA
jgi:hypothetical protein